MAGLSFTWTLRHMGWAYSTIADDRGQAEAITSYVTGGPEYLLRAVTSIVQGAATASAQFEAEGPVFRWFFQRTGSDTEIRLVQAPDSAAPDIAGSVKWSGHGGRDSHEFSAVGAGCLQFGGHDVVSFELDAQEFWPLVRKRRVDHLPEELESGEARGQAHGLEVVQAGVGLDHQVKCARVGRHQRFAVVQELPQRVATGRLGALKHPGDCGSERVYLTTRGHAALYAIQEAVSGIEADLEQELGPAQMTQLRTLLIKLNTTKAVRQAHLPATRHPRPAGRTPPKRLTEIHGARPTGHRKRDPIETCLIIAFTPLAISRWPTPRPPLPSPRTHHPRQLTTHQSEPTRVTCWVSCDAETWRI